MECIFIIAVYNESVFCIHHKMSFFHDTYIPTYNDATILKFCKGAQPMDAAVEVAKQFYGNVLPLLLIKCRFFLSNIQKWYYLCKTLICRKLAVFTFWKTKFGKLLVFWILIYVESQTS